jgi:transposase
VTLTGGNRNDVTQLIPLVDAVPPIRGLCGRPRGKPRELFADRGYDHDSYRRQLRARGITPRIARRGVAHGSGLGRHRWVVECGFAWLHAFKRLRTRYERRADIHLGLLRLACALICYRHLPSCLKRLLRGPREPGRDHPGLLICRSTGWEGVRGATRYLRTRLRP